MNGVTTISSFIETERPFDHLFWASYSVDPLILEFLFSHDISSSLTRPYFHFICDKRKFDEAIEGSLDDPKKVRRLSKLQSNVLFSHERLEGAFHPKMLFFASEDQIKCIVLSGNATSAGIMSNQDLVASFYWSKDKGSKDQAKIASFYQFLVSLNGWNDESKSELENIGTLLPWLVEQSSPDVFYTNARTPLFDQLKGPISKMGLAKDIYIFSPFLDHDLKALKAISAEFSSAKIFVYIPSAMLSVTDPNLTLPSNVVLRTTAALEKKRFHAKYYGFFGESWGYAIWGSANCSFSALLSLERNREILIGGELTFSELQALWPGDYAANTPDVIFQELDHEDSGELKFTVEILKAGFVDDGVAILTNTDFDNAVPILLLANNEVVHLTACASSDRGFVIPCNDKLKVCAVYLSDAVGQRISNAYLLNNFDKVASNAKKSKSTPKYEDIENAGVEGLIKIRNEFFITESAQSTRGSTSNLQDKNDPYAFWQMPKYRNLNSSVGIFGHRSHMERLVNRYKSELVSDEEENSEKKKDQRKPTKKTNRSKSKLNKLTIEASKIFKKLAMSQKDRVLSKRIPFDLWLTGADYLLRLFLDTLDEYEFIEEEDLRLIETFLGNYLHSVFYIMNEEVITKYEEGTDFIESINIASALFLFIAKYAHTRLAIEIGTLSTSGRLEEKCDMLAEAVFLKAKAEQLLTENSLNQNNEAKTLILNALYKRLRHIGAAMKALSFAESDLPRTSDGSLAPNDIVKLNGTIYRFVRLKNRSNYELSTVMRI